MESKIHFSTEQYNRYENHMRFALKRLSSRVTQLFLTSVFYFNSTPLKAKVAITLANCLVGFLAFGTLLYDSLLQRGASIFK